MNYEMKLTFKGVFFNKRFKMYYLMNKFAKLIKNGKNVVKAIFIY